MRITYPLLIAGMITASSVVLATVAVARADDRDCQGFGSLSENPEITLGRIGAGAARTYFVRNGSDAKDCPNATDVCRAKAFLVPGDRVILSRTSGAFVCADFIGAKSFDHPGWLPASAVNPETTPPITLADWVGSWSQVEATITFKLGSKPGTLSISGEATYGSLDPDRVKRGAVNIGNIEGMTSPKGAALSFTMGEGATLPVDKGDEGDCKVWMRRLGPYLLVNDNNNCGGMNVSFSGVYTRKIEPPKGKTKAGIPEKWSATSHTATAITGDVRFSPSKITFENGKALPLTLFEKASLFKDDIEGGVMADIYKVVTPSDPKLLNGNRLCGDTKPVPVTFIAVWKPKSGGVWMAPSSSTTKPKGMDDICGTYGYESG